MGNRHFTVLGGNGRVGHHVVDLLTRAGHTARSISRSTEVDVFTAEGLAQAVTGADCIIDVSSTPSADEQTAIEFFTVAARNLHDVAGHAGIQHIIAVSIIGVDRFTTGYNLGKVAQERELLAGPVPVTIVRAAQFHEFVPLLIQWGTQGDTTYVQKMRTQLVAARSVAEALVAQATSDTPTISLADDSSTLPQVAGPREEYLPDIAELWVTARKIPVTVHAVSDPVDAALYEEGALLPGTGAILAGPTFADWLSQQQPSPFDSVEHDRA